MFWALSLSIAKQLTKKPIRNSVEAAAFTQTACNSVIISEPLCVCVRFPFDFISLRFVSLTYLPLVAFYFPLLYQNQPAKNQIKWPHTPHSSTSSCTMLETRRKGKIMMESVCEKVTISRAIARWAYLHGFRMKWGMLFLPSKFVMFPEH